MPGVRLGTMDAFPSPAYWIFQVMSRRLLDSPMSHRLGDTLAEGVGACLLGGHGIPAWIGLTAYRRLRAMGAFDPMQLPSLTQLQQWLEEPLQANGRGVRYRFAKQKATYLATCLKVVHDAPSFSAGRDLRNWLMQLPGIDPKTASWIARNWMGADDVAILDIHLLRFGRAAASGCLSRPSRWSETTSSSKPSF